MQNISDTGLVFDGVVEAKGIEKSLQSLGKLSDKTLVIIQGDGEGRESTYVRLKREMGERMGVTVIVKFVSGVEEVQREIKKANEDNKIEGILVQLPIKGASRDEIEQVLSTIDTEKDIDGLNPKSEFIPAVVMAVETVLEKINLDRGEALAIVGAEGMTGTRLYDRLIELGFVVSGFDKGDDLIKLVDFDVVISCTGVEGVVKQEMVRTGFVGIDLGYPRAEFSKEAIEKAGVITPVPGGIGPLTMVSLFVNLAETG